MSLTRLEQLDGLLDDEDEDEKMLKDMLSTLIRFLT